MQKFMFRERAAWYNRTYAKWPASHFLITDRWASATWVLGNNYKGSGYYGAYPPGYLPRVHALFPDTQKERVLHLFSGKIKDDPWGGALTVDSNPALGPSIVANALVLSAHRELHKRFDLVLADPPYTVDDAKKYGTTLPSRTLALNQLRPLVPPGGFVLWMDIALPMYTKKSWLHVGHISMVRSTNHRYRGVAVFQRMPEGE